MTVDEKFKVIEKQEEETAAPKTRQTNPIAKKLVEFHQEKIGKFKVKDLFK